MKVFIIDDSIEKINAVRNVLTDNAVKFGKPVHINFCESLSEAITEISTVKYDLIILDLLLPYVPGTPAANGAGLETLRAIRKDNSPNEHVVVIGLSAFPGEIADTRSRFEALGVIVQEYISYDDNWKSLIVQSQSAIYNRSIQKQRLDFLIFVALEKEAIAYEMTDVQIGRHDIVGGLNIQYISIGETVRLDGALIRLRDMGLVTSTFEAATALALFDVRLACMTGICAGFSGEVTLGQVVVGSPVWEYQAGKWAKNGFKIAPKQVSIRANTKVIIEQALLDSIWWDAIENKLPTTCHRPNIKAKPAILPSASGSAVIADPSRLEHIEIQHRKVAALEMEAYGLYFAATEIVKSVDHFFSAKSVVDFADEVKDDTLHEYGCITSARTAVHLIKAMLLR